LLCPSQALAVGRSRVAGGTAPAEHLPGDPLADPGDGLVGGPDQPVAHKAAQVTQRGLHLPTMTNTLCEQLAAWHDQYPDPNATPEQNTGARAREDEWLAEFAGLEALEREQVASLVEWKFQSLANRRVLAMRGISVEQWDSQDGVPGAAELIGAALVASDDYEALATMARRVGGIDHFGPAMSSVILAACRPETYTVADSRALKALRALGLMPAGSRQFRLDDWLPYLAVCRSLTQLLAATRKSRCAVR
jgi:hypothetical protein